MWGDGDAIRFELVRGEGETPLRVVSDGGNTSRLLLAQVASGDGTLLQAVVKVGRDLPLRPLEGGEITQAQAAARHQREAAALAALAGRPGVVQRLAIPGRTLFGGASMAVLCRERWLTFAPPCPSCGAPLAPCTDEATLDRFGLETPASSRHALLYCAACSAAGTATLYTRSLPKGVKGGGTAVVDFGGWLETFGAAVATLPAVAAPCVGCDERGGCFPAAGVGEGASRLLPLAFAPVEVLPLEPLHLRFDEHMALLGGDTWDGLTARSLAGEAQAARRGLVETASLPVRRRPQYLFEGEGDGLFHLEVAHLKVAAFLELLRGVAALHEAVRGPHLRLDPSHVMARVGDPAGPAPGRWGTAVRLIAPGGAAPMVVEGLPTGLFEPPAEVRQAYSAPPVVAPHGRGERAEVTLLTATKGRFEARVGGGLLHAVVNDGLTLQVAGEVALFGRIQRLDGGVLQVAGSLTAAQEQAVAERVGEPFPEAACLHHPTLHVPCDLFSLGRLWFHALLVNDEQAVAAVVAGCDQVVERAAVVAGEADTSGERFRDALLHEIAARPDLFSPLAPLYRSADRMANEAGTPELLWEELLLFGFRLLVWRPAFGFCADRGDYEPDFPRGPIDRAIAVLTGLAAQVHGHLLGSDPFHREVQEALDAVCSRRDPTEGEG